MDELPSIKTFIRVVQTGSFSAAARDSSASVSSISRQVKRLENELGVRLLNRNTRRLSLTDAGRHFYERVSVISQELDKATAEAKSFREDVRGRLKVSLRVAAGTMIVVPALAKFLARHPDLTVDVILTDERKDLIAENIDVALWLGHIPDSEIVARRLAPSQRIVCASPDYLAKRGQPRIPEDVRHHDCLLYDAPSYREEWSFTKDDERTTIPVSGPLRSENGFVLLSAGLSGLGLFVVHEWMVRNLLEEGKVMRVLEDYVVNPRPGDAELYAVYPSSKGLSRTVRVFIDFLVELFSSPVPPSPDRQHDIVSTTAAQ